METRETRKKEKLINTSKTDAARSKRREGKTGEP
jgi:hypothetical protein